MTTRIMDDTIGLPAFNDVSTTQKCALGTIAKVTDPDATIPWAGEAIYIKSSDAILEGSLCRFDPYLAVGTLCPATAGTGPVGAAAAAIPSGSFGWLQISGPTKVKAPNAAVVGADVFPLAATPGSVDDAAVAGEQILGAKFSTTTGTPAAGFAIVQFSRPFCQGQIT